MRHLGGTVHLEDVAGGIVAPDGTAVLDRHPGMPADVEGQLDHGMRAAESIFHIAIVLFDGRGVGRSAGLELAGRRVGREQRRQLLDLDHDEVGRVLGEVGVGGEHGGDRLAHVAHAIPRQDRLPIGDEPLDTRQAKVDRRNVGDITRRPDCAHARQRAGGARIDRYDTAVSHGRTHHAHVQLMRKRDIGRVGAATRHQRAILEPRNRSADEAHLGSAHAAPAARKAARMRCGVAGNSSIETPNGASASLMALRMAAGAPMAPPSPRPLALVTEASVRVSR
jgi:hypothetical protein